MEPAERSTAMVERQVALRDAGHEAVLLELAGAVRPREEAPIVASLLELDDVGAGQGGLDELHRVWSPRQAGAPASAGDSDGMSDSDRSSSHIASGIAVWNIPTFCSISATERTPVRTEATTGLRSGNWIAAAISGTSWRAQTAWIRWALSRSGWGAGT